MVDDRSAPFPLVSRRDRARADRITANLRALANAPALARTIAGLLRDVGCGSPAIAHTGAPIDGHPTHGAHSDPTAATIKQDASGHVHTRLAHDPLNVAISDAAKALETAIDAIDKADRCAAAIAAIQSYAPKTCAQHGCDNPGPLRNGLCDRCRTAERRTGKRKPAVGSKYQQTAALIDNAVNPAID